MNHGFVFSDGVFTTFDFPSPGTTIGYLTINPSIEVKTPRLPVRRRHVFYFKPILLSRLSNRGSERSQSTSCKLPIHNKLLERS